MNSIPLLDVVVIGAGPAGASVALGLARLGWRVAVVSTERAFAACEGISERVLHGLRQAGLQRAANSVAPPSPREACWDGIQRSANSERLLRRQDFDRVLRSDIEEAGIEYHAARVRLLRRIDSERVGVYWDGGGLQASFVVDARGRSAPRARGERLRGPESLTLLQRWSGPAGEAGSGVFACENGWIWCARLPDGERYTQCSIDARDPNVPAQRELAAWFAATTASMAEMAAFVAGCDPVGEPVARASTSVLQRTPCADRMLRVGDAAMAVDPLSGNGIFQALSSASVAPAVINTLLREPENAELATRFYTDRVRHIFERFARSGRDFYCAESRWQDQPFWQARRAWPDELPAHDSIVPRFLGLELRAVVESGFIRERLVALTSDQPLGVWRVAGVELATLLAELPGEPDLRRAVLHSRIAVAAESDSALATDLASWCRKYSIDSLPGSK